LCVSIFFGCYYGITGITIAVTLSAIFSYIAMLITIKRHVFKHGWSKLIFQPFRDGAIISVLTIIPSYLLYQGMILVFKDELISFSVLCVLLGAFFAYAFFKKPKLLGQDFVQLRKELMKMGKKGKGGKGRRKGLQMDEEANNIVEITE